jgi:cell division protein WhiA
VAAVERAGHDPGVVEREQLVGGEGASVDEGLCAPEAYSRRLDCCAGRRPTPPGGAGISFSADVKDELAGLLPARSCCQLSELLGLYVGSRARIVATAGGQAAYFSLLRNAVARKVVRLGRAMGRLEARYQVVKTRKRMTFVIELVLPPGLVPAFAQRTARELPDAACDRKAMLRGLFLGCGSVNAPRSRYHLEFVAPSASWASLIAGLAEGAGARAGIMERAGQYVVYVKEGDAIVRLLSMMGASRAVMEFENVRVVRQVSGEVNRRLNFETANIGKTIGSGLRQAAAVQRLDEAGALAQLPAALREMARWRSAHPRLNLAELAARMELSKSAVNHRLRRLQQIADSLGNGGATRRSAPPNIRS